MVKITAGSGSAAVPAIRFQAGARLHIRLADDAGEFRKSGWSGETPVFGIPMVSGFVALAMVGSDAGGRDFEMLVPFGMTHRVMAMSKSFSLADEKGAGVSGGGLAIPVHFAEGSTPAPVVVHLTGKK